MKGTESFDDFDKTAFFFSPAWGQVVELFEKLLGGGEVFVVLHASNVYTPLNECQYPYEQSIEDLQGFNLPSYIQRDVGAYFVRPLVYRNEYGFSISFSGSGLSADPDRSE